MATRTRDGEDAAINLYCQQMGDVQISRPLGSVPPDAIIKHQDGRFEWIEVTSVWLGQTQNKHASFAKAVNNCSSYEGTFDYHFPNGYWKAIHADLIYSIKKKDEKVGYQTLLKEYGKGILILNLEDPYYASDLTQIDISTDFSEELNCFKSVFLHLSALHEWSGGSIQSYPSRLLPVSTSKKKKD